MYDVSPAWGVTSNSGFVSPLAISSGTGGGFRKHTTNLPPTCITNFIPGDQTPHCGLWGTLSLRLFRRIFFLFRF
jgi:hypothetical protein